MQDDVVGQTHKVWSFHGHAEIEICNIDVEKLGARVDRTEFHSIFIVDRSNVGVETSKG